MKKFKSIFALAIALTALMTMSSCSEDVPVYETYEYQGPTENGNLKVFARQDMIYFQGAIVKVYLSNQARQNDEAFITTLTESHGASPSDSYAIINDLDPKTYYLFVSTEYNGETIIGKEDGGNGIFVPKGVTSSIHVQLTN